MELEFLDFESADVKKMGRAPSGNMNAQIDITNVEMKKNRLNLNFVFGVTYSPGGSYMNLTGSASFSGNGAKKAHDEWKKTKRISGVEGEQIINAINYSASVNSIFIARVFNMTPPIVPPLIQFGEAKTKKKKTPKISRKK